MTCGTQFGHFMETLEKYFKENDPDYVGPKFRVQINYRLDKD